MTLHCPLCDSEYIIGKVPNYIHQFGIQYEVCDDCKAKDDELVDLQIDEDQLNKK